MTTDTLDLPIDPEASAKEAGLRYVTDTGPGVHRRRAGRGFTYLGPDGKRITDPERLAWFRRLAIPRRGPTCGSRP